MKVAQMEEEANSDIQLQFPRAAQLLLPPLIFQVPGTRIYILYMIKNA